MYGLPGMAWHACSQFAKQVGISNFEFQIFKIAEISKRPVKKTYLQAYFALAMLFVTCYIYLSIYIFASIHSMLLYRYIHVCIILGGRQAMAGYRY